MPGDVVMDGFHKLDMGTMSALEPNPSREHVLMAFSVRPVP